jgi:hypothetical protein
MKLEVTSCDLKISYNQSTYNGNVRTIQKISGRMVLRRFSGELYICGRTGLCSSSGKGDDLEARFLIQSRAVAKQDQERLKIASADVPVALLTETGLAFCPWCGVNLARFYRKRLAELDRPGLSITLPTSPP